MSTATQHREPATDWEQEIRTLEEQGRLAFLAGDTAALDAMWATPGTTSRSSTSPAMTTWSW
jgi:hypothetical protein